MKKFINKLIFYSHNNFFLKKIFKTLNYCIEKELTGINSVLDIGCGPDSPLKNVKNVSYKVGVEPFKEYVLISKKMNIHHEYINKNIFDVDFEENSFEAIMLIDVLEHMEKIDALNLILKAKKWAKKKIIISTPNGYVKQGELDNNPLQKHLCGFDINELSKLGFNCKGTAGLKFLRKDLETVTMDGELLNNIRFKPKLFFFILASLSQIFCYWTPKYSFGLFGTFLKK